MFSVKKPDIFDYQNYRLFLFDLYTSKKKTRAGYSFRRFSVDLGFKATNAIYLVIKSRRNLSLKGIENIKKHLSWNSRQKSYFHHLVYCNQEKNEFQRQYHEQQLEKIIGKKTKTLHEDQYSYFSKWYIPVIRELFNLKDFVPSLDWISKKLRPTVDHKLVTSALNILTRLGLIKKEGSFWKQTESNLSTESTITSTLVHEYQKEMLKQALSALRLPASKRDIATMTIGLSLAQFQWLKQRLYDFRYEIQRDLQEISGEPTLVVQLNTQLFPLTADYKE